MIASLTFARPDWLWLSAAAVLAVSTLTWILLRASTSKFRTKAVITILRCCATLLIALALVEPLWSGMRVVPGANQLLILTDNSDSMTIADSFEGENRLTTVDRIVNGEDNGWLDTLGQDFAIQQHRMHSSTGTSGSEIHSRLKVLHRQNRGRAVAATILLTDGVGTDELQRLEETTTGPIYPVLIGGQDALADLAIESVSVSQTSFEDAPVTVDVRVRSTNIEQADVSVSLKSCGSNDVEWVQSASLTAEEPVANLRFMLKPAAIGATIYQAVVTSSEVPQEATTQNNSRWITIDNQSQPKRILYVAGRPNWEYKFLRRSVQEDRSIALTGLLRIAKREPKFDWRGHDDENSNALYRGFDDGENGDQEQFDEAVTIRLDTRDRDELKEGFPATLEELCLFDALILDDLEAEFLTQSQWDILHEFVTERGGAVLFLGGQESFNRQDRSRFGPAELWPMTFDHTPLFEPDRELLWKPTRDGWLAPWLRVEQNEVAERRRHAELPFLRTMNRVGHPKPAARVMAQLVDQAGKTAPGLITQQLGHGRTAAIPAGDLWRWQLGRNESTGAENFQKQWRQVLRWLTVDVRPRMEFIASEESTSIAPKLLIRNAAFQPATDVTPTVTVTDPDGVVSPVRVEPSLQHAGTFELFWHPTKTGVWRFESRCEVEKDRVLTQTMGVVFDPRPDEFARTTPDREAMDAIAQQSGGRVIQVDELDSLADELAFAAAPVMEPWSRPFWHEPWFFLLAAACFVVEWGVRRRAGLA